MDRRNKLMKLFVLIFMVLFTLFCANQFFKTNAMEDDKAKNFEDSVDSRKKELKLRVDKIVDNCGSAEQLDCFFNMCLKEFKATYHAFENLNFDDDLEYKNIRRLVRFLESSINLFEGINKRKSAAQFRSACLLNSDERMFMLDEEIDKCNKIIGEINYFLNEIRLKFILIGYFKTVVEQELNLLKKFTPYDELKVD